MRVHAAIFFMNVIKVYAVRSFCNAHDLYVGYQESCR